MSELNVKEAIEYINSNFRLLDVIRDYGFEPLPAGNGRWRLICPFHTDNAPSFMIFEDTNTAFCFGCRVSTDIVEFVKRSEGVDFKKAISLLVGDDPKLGQMFLKKRAEKLLEKKVDPIDKVLRELNFGTSVVLRELGKAKAQELPWIDQKFYEIDKFLQSKPALEIGNDFFRGLIAEAARRSS